MRQILFCTVLKVKLEHFCCVSDICLHDNCGYFLSKPKRFESRPQSGMEQVNLIHFMHLG